MSKAVYELFQVRNSKDPLFIEGLEVYARETFSGEKTDTNEITFWLDNYHKKHSEDKFLVFVLRKNNKTIGYTQFVYFRKNRIAYFDYMAILEEHRGANAFFEFFEQLRHYLIRELKLDIDYVLTDITYRAHGNQPSDFTRLFVRLLKICGFGVLKAQYIVPMLGYGNHESEMPAIFLIQPMTPQKEIKAATYKQMVRLIFFDHYLRWYTPFLEKKEPLLTEYRIHLDNLYSRCIAFVEKRDIVQINGYIDSMQESISENPSTFPKKNILFLLFAFIIFLLFVTTLLLFLRIYLQLSDGFLWMILAFSFVFFLTILSIFSEKPRELLKHLLGKYLP